MCMKNSDSVLGGNVKHFVKGKTVFAFGHYKDHTRVLIKDPVVHVSSVNYESTQNNPACTYSLRVFKMLELDRIRKEEGKIRQMTGRRSLHVRI